MGAAAAASVESVLRITARAPDLNTFVMRFARHVRGDHIFLFSKAPKPVGTQLRFILRLSNGEMLIEGTGTVVRMQTETGDKRHPPGMELQFSPVDERSKEVVGLLHSNRTSLRVLPPLVSAALGMYESPPPAALPPDEPTFRSPPPVPTSPGKRTVPLAALSSAAPMTAQEITRDTVPNDVSPLPPTTALLAATLGPAPPPVEAPPLVAASPVVAAPVAAPPEVEGLADPNQVPANPFGEISDGTIDYFVEWSFEKSVGVEKDSSASFSQVEMKLTRGDEGFRAAAEPAALPPEPSPQRSGWKLVAGVGVGIAIGGAAMWGLQQARQPKPDQREPAAAAAPVAAAPISPAPPAALKKDPVSATIVTVPAGAAIEIDGKSAGTTPATIQLAPGAHEVTLKRERYVPASETFEAPGELKVTLKRPSATLSVSSLPPGKVFVNGAEEGMTPLSLTLARYEQYEVKVVAPNTKLWRKKFYLAPAQMNLSATLPRTPATAGAKPTAASTLKPFPGAPASAPAKPAPPPKR